MYEEALRQSSNRDLLVQNRMRWLLTFGIGLVTALVAVFITYSTKKLTDLRFAAVNALIDRERNGSAFNGSAYLCHITICVAYAVCAAFPVCYFAPVAAGSGISEIKVRSLP